MGRSLVSRIRVPRITSSFAPQKRGGELFSGGFGGKDTVKLNQKSGKSIRKQRMWSMYTLLWAAAGIRSSEAYRGWCTDKSATIRGGMQRVRHLKRWEIKICYRSGRCRKQVGAPRYSLQAPLRKPNSGGHFEWPGGPGAAFHEAGLSPIATSQIIMS